MKFTSTCSFNAFILNNGKEDMVESPIFDCGAILDPYLVTHAAMDSEQGRSPVMCVQCAAYLSSYATINKATGEWSCCLCAAINPRFHQDYQTMHLVSRSADFVPTTNSIQHGGNCPGNSNDLRELQLRSMYAELRGPHCTFTEDEETTLHYQGTSISAVSTELFGGIAIFAIDADLLNEKHVVSLLCEGIMHLSDFCEVSILLYGRHISGLRLGTGVLSQANPISADIFPGIADKSCLFAHLVQRRAYSIRAESLKGHLDALRSCLTNLATVTITAPHLANTAECAVDAIVDLAVALIASHRSPAASSAAERGRAGNLIFFSSRVLNCRGGGGRNAHISGTPTTENLLGQSLETFSALGKWALSKHCHLDVLHATLRGSNLDQLDALVGPSGGSVVSGNSFEEEHVRTSLLQLVARVSRNDTAQGTGAAFGSGVGIGNICYSRLPTLEIRTCGKLAVDRIVGPILAPDNVVHHNALASMGASVKDKGVPKIVRSADDVSELTYPAAELALDSAHLAHSLHFQEMQAGSFVAPTDSSRIREALYEQLVKLNQLNVVISGINLRRLTANAPHGAQDCITVQFKQNTDEGRDRVKTNSPYSKGNMFIGTVADSAEEREKERIRAHQLQDDAAYVQFVVRYWEYTAAGNNVVGGGSGGGVRKVTRIWTQRLPVTSSKEEYLSGLDAPLWACIMSRGVVADYHTECARAFGGARRYKLDEQGQYLFSTLKTTAESTVDALVRAVALQWPLTTGSIRQKAQTVCRLLYHLREGPLLDGPAADPMEAYLLRSLFLKSDYQQTLRIVMPSLQLAVNMNAHGDCTNENTSSVELLTTAYPPPSLPTTSTATPPTSLHILYPPPPSQPVTQPLTQGAGLPLGAPLLGPPSGPPPFYPGALLSGPPLGPPSDPPSGPPPLYGLPATYVPPPPTCRSATGPGGGAGAPITQQFPPPITPPPSLSSTSSVGVGASAALMYAPPPGPPPGPPPSSLHSAPPASASAATAPAAGTEQVPPLVMLELPADSTSLLPNTIAVLDCGDHIIIRRNAVLSPSDDFAGGSSSSSSVISSKSNERGDKRDTALQDFSKVLMRRVEEHVRAVAAQRYPAPSVHVLHKPGTPQDRILYCRLTPTHMDAKENIFAATTAELQSCTRNFAHRPEEHAQHRSNALSLLQNLTMQTVEGVVAQAPYTDQLYFAKYLAQVAPVQAAKLLSKSALDPEEGMKAAPMSQYMDRGGGDKGSAPTPAVVLSPLIPPPTAGSANSSGSVHGSTFRNMHSSKSALPL